MTQPDHTRHYVCEHTDCLTIGITIRLRIGASYKIRTPTCPVCQKLLRPDPTPPKQPEQAKIEVKKPEASLNCEQCGNRCKSQSGFNLHKKKCKAMIECAKLGEIDVA